jgi:iron complex transport system substrate-binding protein
MLFAIGAGPNVVGVGSHDRYPPEVASRPRVGALVDPDLERILGLRPDLVIAYASQADLQRQLARAGIDVFAYRHGGLADVLSTLRDVGRRTGRPAEADRLAASLERRLEATRARVAARPRPRVMLVFGREAGTLRGIYASGAVGFLHDMLVIAGGDNVFDDVDRESIQVSTEVILARRPDVIVELVSFGSRTSADVQTDHAWDALGSVPAVRHRRILALVGEEFVVPGPRVADAVAQLAEALHPDVR